MAVGIAGVLALLGGAVSGALAVGGFLANILSLPFRVFEGHRILTELFYWGVLFVDAIIVGNFTNELFSSVGVEGITLNFSSIFLLPINVPLGFVFNWAVQLQAVHFLIILSLVLVAEFTLFIARTFTQ